MVCEWCKELEDGSPLKRVAVSSSERVNEGGFCHYIKKMYNLSLSSHLR